MWGGQQLYSITCGSSHVCKLFLQVPFVYMNDSRESLSRLIETLNYGRRSRLNESLGSSSVSGQRGTNGHDSRVETSASQRGTTTTWVCVYKSIPLSFCKPLPQHTHTHNAQLAPSEDKYLIKNTSAEVDYMYLAQIISPGSHVHCVITAPVSGPPAVITMNAKQQF